MTEDNKTTESNEINIFNVTDVHEIRTMYCNQQAQIASLKDKLGMIEAQRDDYKDQVTKREVKHQSDINTIGEALIEIAEDKEWCSEYDDFIQELNSDLFVELPTRKRDFELTVRVTRTVYTDVTVTIEATTEDEAEHIFNEESYSHLGGISDYISDWVEDDEEIDVRDTRRA